jgi:hypothetical protein
MGLKSSIAFRRCPVNTGFHGSMGCRVNAELQTSDFLRYHLFYVAFIADGLSWVGEWLDFFAFVLCRTGVRRSQQACNARNPMTYIG